MRHRAKQPDFVPLETCNGILAPAEDFGCDRNPGDNLDPKIAALRMALLDLPETDAAILDMYARGFGPSEIARTSG
ncbi:MAG: hypothetical protein H5U03_09240 [Clostridia bacterium]|nr:hypothetical protein [Clostridia bacterium]